jgi:cytochrome c-type biogenesis protein CcmI
MLFWIIATLPAFAIAATLAFALLRPNGNADGQSEDIIIYRDQLAEVDRDLARGVLDADEAERSVTLTNEQWSILAMCAEAYSTTFRKQQSEFVTTYVTRNQLDEAVAQAAKMNAMLQKLDKLQAKLV